MTEIFTRRNKAEIFGKRGDVGLCQLCNTETQMSKSHVPPKSCIESRLLKRHASPYFFGQQQFNLQDGVHYFTLCGDCNSHFGRYDEELAYFSKELQKIGSSPLKVVACKPNKMARALIGSVLVVCGKYIDEAYKSQLQSYACDEGGSLPSNLKIGFWTHPDDTVVVNPEIFLVKAGGETHRILFIVKYFPLSWVIYIDEQKSQDFGAMYQVEDFSKYLDADIDRKSNVLVDLRNEKHAFWPHPSDGFTIFTGKCFLNTAIHAPPTEITSQNMASL